MSAHGRDRALSITWRPTTRICAKLDAVQDVLEPPRADLLDDRARSICDVPVARLVIAEDGARVPQLASAAQGAPGRDHPGGMPRLGSTMPAACTGLRRDGCSRGLIGHQVRTSTLIH